MEPNERQFNHLKQLNDLVGSNPWQGAVLFCLQAGPLRWTDIARDITIWSGERPSESQITRALEPLQRRGYVNKAGGPSRRRGHYSITDAGRERAIRIAALIQAFEGIDAKSDD